ncbi:uncharacterized protein At1g01500-like isoform X2 [Malania oleifera]|uniref:uncharacterized protein At1g01500-like isoform X2 n=1 Tax=Malania oleifera TaxID=397392 RepID=UPI0025AE5CE0|nr:uncharacterized protein At1g01500-like isoform X2 [Malania oleifera]XP_057975681.1 uncharacterized protein At1g01500-like isoform X2 [Malania oleifera]XP_057975682.1 uncharacterized protein At1g01500-like isoform X2 [Malania oleifera]XP_057975683.1 uncharacterized protein At1g01500-like isoform X2 [Malania oleifera]
MECSYETLNKDEPTDPCLQIITSKSPLSWFDLRVFYVRISNFEVDDSTPEFLTLNHIPLNRDTLLEVNGARSGIYSDGVSSLLRRDRVDKKSEEATFVCTDSIRLTGSVKFEVFDREDFVLSGVLEMSCRNGFTGESKGDTRRWSMNCESGTTNGSSFLRIKHQTTGPELPLPTIEVYIAGCFAGTPIILTKTLQLSHRKKHNRKGMLDSIPENETTEGQKNVPSALDMVSEYKSYKLETKEEEEEYEKYYYWRAEFGEGEDGELSWFNAGVRVGVGIGLGICLGIGIGVGLLVRTYQSTTRGFKRRLL